MTKRPGQELESQDEKRLKQTRLTTFVRLENQKLPVPHQIAVHASQATFRDARPKCLTIEEVTGDIFDGPANSVLIHACNCIGSWGAGIAAAFKSKYPDHFKIYKDHCSNGSNRAALCGTSKLIIPAKGSAPQHYVGCLFTSKDVGRRKDSPATILANTKPAMEHLLHQIAVMRKSGSAIGELRMCQINSGLFNVPWEKTKELLSLITVTDEDMPDKVIVFSRE